MTIRVESCRVREELSVLVNGLAGLALGAGYRCEPIIRRGVVRIERNRLLQLYRRFVQSACPGKHDSVVQTERGVPALELYRHVQLRQGGARIAECERRTGETDVRPVEREVLCEGPLKGGSRGREIVLLHRAMPMAYSNISTEGTMAESRASVGPRSESRAASSSATARS